MNRTFLPILTLTAALVILPCSVSCSKNNQPDKNKDDQEQQGQK
jgi:hypothetical protein